VTCLPVADPTHRFLSRHGGRHFGQGCDPGGGEVRVDFPACDPAALCDNRLQIAEWLDGEETVFGVTPELRAFGERPLAAALRDLKDSLLAAMIADDHSACRRYDVVAVIAGTDSCEDPAAIVAAATELQNLSFTNAAGVFVADYDVEVNLVGYGVCPVSVPNCANRASLQEAAAAAGGLYFHIDSSHELALGLTLEQLASDAASSAFRCDLFSDDFESGDMSAWTVHP
jgi:hypothetical protein